MSVVIVVVVLVVVVLPLVAGMIVLITRKGRQPASAPAPTSAPVDLPFTIPPIPPVAPTAPAPGPDPVLATDRDRLVHTLMAVRDQLDSLALRAWIDEALGQVAGPDVAAARDRVVRTLIDVRDQIDDAGLRATIAASLGQAGVQELVADGQRFDPNAHRAIDYVAVADPAYDLVVAQTSRPGYLDRGRVLRLPEVLVYRAGDGR